MSVRCAICEGLAHLCVLGVPHLVEGHGGGELCCRCAEELGNHMVDEEDQDKAERDLAKFVTSDPCAICGAHVTRCELNVDHGHTGWCCTCCEELGIHDNARRVIGCRPPTCCGKCPVMACACDSGWCGVCP